MILYLSKEGTVASNTTSCHRAPINEPTEKLQTVHLSAANTTSAVMFSVPSIFATFRVGGLVEPPPISNMEPGKHGSLIVHTPSPLGDGFFARESLTI